MALAKILFFLLLHHLPLLKVDSQYLKPDSQNCGESFQCGQLGSLKFPFSKDSKCRGLFVVKGCDTGFSQIQLVAGGYWYGIRRDTLTNKFLISDLQLQKNLNDKSCLSFRNFSLPQSPFVLFTLTSPNLTLFECSNSNQTPNENIVQVYFQNYSKLDCPPFAAPDPPFTVYYRNSTTKGSSIPTGCSMIQLPKNPYPSSSEWFNLLSAEFTMEWNVSDVCSHCYHGGGKCLSDNYNAFYCKNGLGKHGRIVIIGFATFTSILSAFVFIWRKYELHRFFGFQKAKPGNEKDIELFLKNNGNLAPIRYKYSDIKMMTKSFSDNVGKGGYGSVYKGKLIDGRLVAVKILNESKGNGEEFVNEVASISRTSHVNIVSLLGFCFEGSKRALIFEFMPNGSLEKFIQNNASSSAGGGLGWQKLFEIALGIARGLEYLHQGCKTRIVHFDIKPHNILLDKDFNPRISDFGLAKLCPNRSSIVSMLVARGTIGYIAPEVFCRNFGEVSHKSDVYSYGMMVLEIAGGKKNIDPRDGSTSDVYFPQYIYKQLEIDAERDGSLARNEDDNQFVKRKLIIVGLWSIQTDPNDRPSMTKVVEMLEGKVESLQVPPKPYLSSPPRSTTNFSTSESM